MIGISQPMTVEQAIEFLQGLPDGVVVTSLVATLGLEEDDLALEPWFRPDDSVEKFGPLFSGWMSC